MVQRSKVFKEKSAQTKQQHGDYKLFWIFLKYFSITMKKYAHIDENLCGIILMFRWQ